MRAITSAQIGAVRTALGRSVAQDLAQGVSPLRQLFCGGCQTGRPLPGCRDYGKHTLCPDCAAEYEVACLRGSVATIGQYIRDKRFGEEAHHSLTMLLLDGDGDDRHGTVRSRRAPAESVL